ncbi:MAG TPA: sirohydrochlorin cobaltochelatase [Thermoanaerobacterales bacterium]|nr:sirohydrochlorin cobaltochelatase [Thermoanaerobacterales bacterium]
MKKHHVLMIIGFLICSLLLVACGNSEQTGGDKVNEENKESKEVVQEKGDKKGILVVSFGTSYADTRKVTIEACEEKIAASFPDYEVRKAFTSDIIIKKLKERDNIEIDNPEQALNKMKEDGFTEVIVQPLHIIPGIEYEEVLAAVDNFKDSFKEITVGRPILYGIEDYKVAVEALKQQLPELNKDQAVILMGHGTNHPANACYSCLQSVLDDEGLSVFVGTVEGYPEIDDVIAKLKQNNIKEVTLMPYMVVAGDHASNDMAGDEEDSWKNILKKEGFVVNIYLHGLGENAGYQDIYVQRVQDCIDGNPLGVEEE